SADAHEAEHYGLSVVVREADVVRCPLVAIRRCPVAARIVRSGGQCAACGLKKRGPAASAIAADVHAERVEIAAVVPGIGVIEGEQGAAAGGKVDGRCEQAVLLAGCGVAVVVDRPRGGGSAR